MSDNLGDRIKAYEAAETERSLMPLLPIIGRIDGRCFSSFTQGMERPYDKRLHACLVDTTRHLVKQTQAISGYTQSDEITLLWYAEDYKTQMIFGGKPFKMMSVAAALTTALFIERAREHWPEKIAAKPVSFDCRVFQVPNKDEAANAFLWRELDATKNAISMAARHYYSHNQLHEKTGNEMQEMLFQKGVNFNDYAPEFKRGTFLLRKTVNKELPPEVLARIPEAHRPTGPIERQVIEAVEMPKFSTVTNRVAVLFDGSEPTVAQATATMAA